MALLMEKGAEPQTLCERANLDGITALKESTAIELKEKGNEFVKKGKKHYLDANIDCYSRAINNQALSDQETSVLFSNRPHVNLLLGNFRRALTDAEEAIKLCNTNVNALYRAAKACLSLNLLPDSIGCCKNGLVIDPSNEWLQKLLGQVELKKMELALREAQLSKALSRAKEIVCAIEKRGLKIGKPMYQKLAGSRNPVLEKNSILHWPVLLLYPEVMSSDFIEDFCETEMSLPHLDMMFAERAPPLPWDEEHNYTLDAVELYYEVFSRSQRSELTWLVEIDQLLKHDILRLCYSEIRLNQDFHVKDKETLRYLLGGTPASNLECIGEEEKEATENSLLGSSAVAPNGSK